VSDIATVNHRDPCSKCGKKIKAGDRIRVYATAGGGMDDGYIYWMHDTCPLAPPKDVVGESYD
jgi:hypothetical protein